MAAQIGAQQMVDDKIAQINGRQKITQGYTEVRRRRVYA